MRFVVEVFPADDERVEGTVRRDGLAEAEYFCGWLELLRLLKPDGPANEPHRENRVRPSGVHPGMAAPRLGAAGAVAGDERELNGWDEKFGGFQQPINSDG